jgi:hypothetical protein
LKNIYKHKRPPTAKAILSKKRHHNIWSQTILQNHNNKNSMVLAQKQTGRPMEHNKRSRHKLMHL